jgi:AcrR family transcriptional regulator
MREEVVGVAMQLFATRGFDAVTTSEIASAAGISPRSFFRYFATKEDVVLGSLADAGVRVRDALIARPVEEGAWDALQQALHVLTEHPVYPREHLDAIARVILHTPSIRAKDAEKYREWEFLLAPETARRLQRSGLVLAGEAEDAARALVGAAVAALRIATERWLRTDGTTDARAVLDGLLEVVRTA